VAARDGKPWIKPTILDCPPPPDSVAALIDLGPGTRLACFADGPIELEGDLVAVDADIDYIPYQTPAKFKPVGPGSSSRQLFIADAGKVDLFSNALDLRVEDPAAVPPNVTEPMQVRIVGHFDDPASADCRRPADDWPGANDETAVMACRTDFIVTSIVPID
jgi:hypothetical protein